MKIIPLPSWLTIVLRSKWCHYSFKRIKKRRVLKTQMYFLPIRSRSSHRRKRRKKNMQRPLFHNSKCHSLIKFRRRLFRKKKTLRVMKKRKNRVNRQMVLQPKRMMNLSLFHKLSQIKRKMKSLQSSMIIRKRSRN